MDAHPLRKGEHEKTDPEFLSIAHPKDFMKKGDLSDLRAGPVFRSGLFLMKKFLGEKFKRLFGVTNICLICI